MVEHIDSESVKRLLPAIDAFIARCDSARSDPEMRQVFASQPRFDIEIPAHDPDSDQYREVILELYSLLAGKPYQLENEYTSSDWECTPANIVRIAETPWPFSTLSPQLVGAELTRMGGILGKLPYRPGARIAVMGDSHGNLSEILLRMGFEVVVYEINPLSCAVMRRRNKSTYNNKIQFVIHCGDFSLIQYNQNDFDAIIFYKSFHHALHFQELLRHCNTKLKPDGQLILAAEPIVQSYFVPWGLRLDSQSVWAIRKFGWLELGFDAAYFDECLKRTGFTVVDNNPNLLIAKRA